MMVVRHTTQHCDKSGAKAGELYPGLDVSESNQNEASLQKDDGEKHRVPREAGVA